jgi:hypothetical protein
MKIMCLWASNQKKYEKIYFFVSLKSVRKESDPELDPDTDPIVIGTDPGIRIRTKMTWISNTGPDQEIDAKLN